MEEENLDLDENLVPIQVEEDMELETMELKVAMMLLYKDLCCN